MKIFSGRSNEELSLEIARNLGKSLGDIELYNFSDGEIRVAFKENIRNEDVFIIQSTNPPSDNILELLFMLDAARRASANRVIAVIPYFGYARQDRKDEARVPISARVVLDLISVDTSSRTFVVLVILVVDETISRLAFQRSWTLFNESLLNIFF